VTRSVKIANDVIWFDLYMNPKEHQPNKLKSDVLGVNQKSKNKILIFMH